MDTREHDEAAANLVLAAMEAAEVSRLELSERTLIPRTTLLRRLSGATSFTLAEIHAIAAALDVPAGSLIPNTEAVA